MTTPGRDTPQPGLCAQPWDSQQGRRAPDWAELQGSQDGVKHSSLAANVLTPPGEAGAPQRVGISENPLVPSRSPQTSRGCRCRGRAKQPCGSLGSLKAETHPGNIRKALRHGNGGRCGVSLPPTSSSTPSCTEPCWEAEAQQTSSLFKVTRLGSGREGLKPALVGPCPPKLPSGTQANGRGSGLLQGLLSSKTRGWSFRLLPDCLH